MFNQELLIQLQNIFLGLFKNESQHDDDDVDGIPLDGTPLKDDDIDGVPIDHSTMFKTSKWETVTEEEPGGKGEDYNGAGLYDDIDGAPLDDTCDDNLENRLTRDQLRTVEMKVAKHQDELEDDIRKGRFTLRENEKVKDLVENFRREIIKKTLSQASPPSAPPSKRRK